MNSRRLTYLVPAALIAVASLVRIVVCLQHNPMDYLQLADPGRHWMNGLRFPKGAYFGASDPIGYQIYISVLHRLTGDSSLQVGSASALMSVLMPWTYYRAARNFGFSKIPALWVWALIAWMPSLLAIYHYIMMETLLLLVEGIALWATARHLRTGGKDAFLVSVFFWTIACLTKPTVLPLAGVCLLWSCWKKTPSLRTMVAGIALTAVLLLPQAIRSEVALGFAAPFGNPWLTRIQHRSGVKTLYVNFYTHPNSYFHFKSDPIYAMLFSSPSCYMHPLAPLSDWTIRRGKGRSQLILTIDSAQGVRDWKKGYADLHTGAREWLNQWGENIVLFFFAPSWPESAGIGLEDRLEGATRWLWAPLILLVFAGNFRFFLNRRFELIPAATTLFTLFLALQNLVTSEGRYRKPLEALLLLNLVWILATEFTKRDELRDAAWPIGVVTP
jgi:Dolichyl-phosphate-mannose-protein mannosyltransferase